MHDSNTRHKTYKTNSPCALAYDGGPIQLSNYEDRAYLEEEKKLYTPY